MLLIIIWYFFIIIFGLGLGLGFEVLASFNITSNMSNRCVLTGAQPSMCLCITVDTTSSLKPSSPPSSPTKLHRASSSSADTCFWYFVPYDKYVLCHLLCFESFLTSTEQLTCKRGHSEVLLTRSEIITMQTGWPKWCKKIITSSKLEVSLSFPRWRRYVKVTFKKFTKVTKSPLNVSLILANANNNKKPSCR